jgi:hypothetical protein
MDTLVLKLVLTPLLIGAASLAQRRWGALAGGLIVGLPLTSGPVAFFLALDHGESFAARAAIATIAGLVAEIAFCLAYAWAGRRSSWPVAALAACGAFVACLPLLRVAPASLLGTYAACLAILLVARGALGRRLREPDGAPPSRPAWWDLPARMAVATAFVLALTEAAGALGPRWSGLLAPFPIYAGVLAAFTHAHQGPETAGSLLHGVLGGLFAFATFFAVLAATIRGAGIAAAFALAAAAAFAVQVAVVRITRRPGARPRGRRTGCAARPGRGA